MRQSNDRRTGIVGAGNNKTKHLCSSSSNLGLGSAVVYDLVQEDMIHFGAPAKLKQDFPRGKLDLFFDWRASINEPCYIGCQAYLIWTKKFEVSGGIYSKDQIRRLIQFTSKSNISLHNYFPLLRRFVFNLRRQMN